MGRCMGAEGGQAALLRGRKTQTSPKQQRCRLRSLPFSLEKPFLFRCALGLFSVRCAPNLGSIPLNTAPLLLLPDSFLTRPPGPPPARPPPPPALRTSTYAPQPIQPDEVARARTPPTHAPTQPPTFSKLDHIRTDVIPPRKLKTVHKHGLTPQTYKG
jgi:hypothetical protein